jgi:hypothetical protein
VNFVADKIREELQKTPSPPEGEALEADVQHHLRTYLDLCRDVVVEWLGKNAPETPVQLARLGQLLGMAGTIYARERQRRLIGCPESVRNHLKTSKTRSLFCLTRAIDAELPASRAEECRDSVVSKLAVRFDQAISPTQLGALQNKPSQFAERVTAFVERSSWDEGQLRQHIHGVFIRAGLADGDVRRIIERLGLPKLASHPDTMLETIARNYREWDWVVLGFESGKWQGSEKLKDLLDEQSKRVGEVLARYGMSQYGYERVMDTLLEKLRYYTYEATLPAWLFKTATSVTRSKEKTFQDIDVPAQTPIPPHEVQEALAEANPQHLLVRTTFRKDTWPALDVFFSMCAAYMTGVNPHPPRRAELLSAINESGKQKYTLMGVSLLLRRYRQRFEVIQFIRRMTHAEPNADPPRDKEVLEMIRKQYYPRAKAIANAEANPLRQVAALTRVGVALRSNHLVLAAAYLVDALLSVEDTLVLVWPGGVEERHTGPPCDIARTLANNRPAIDRLRKELRKEKLGFWTSSVALLVLAMKKGLEETANILDADENERQRLQDAVRRAAEPRREDRP